MSGITFTVKAALRYRLDCRGLNPDRLAGLALEDIAAVGLSYAGKKARVDDLFDIDGNDPSQITFGKATDKLINVGRDLNAGRIIVRGDVGDYLGRDMRDGEIIVNGNAGDFAGSGMRNGLIHIKGSVGDYAGGAAEDAMQGLRGGTLMVSGEAGTHLGFKMRRGLIIAQQKVGAYCGRNMIAGTIILGAKHGPNPGLGMRRGTILILEKPGSLPATFNACGSFDLPFLAVLRRHLHAINHTLAGRLSRIVSIRRYVGDLGYDGQGEILVAEY